MSFESLDDFFFQGISTLFFKVKSTCKNRRKGIASALTDEDLDYLRNYDVNIQMLGEINAVNNNFEA